MPVPTRRKQSDDVRVGVERTQNIDPKHMLYALHKDEREGHCSRLTPYARRLLGVRPFPRA